MTAATITALNDTNAGISKNNSLEVTDQKITDQKITDQKLSGQEFSKSQATSTGEGFGGANAEQSPAPWQDPNVLVNTREPVFFRRLKQRLAAIPVQSKHRNQSLFIDLRTGQHWLQLKLTRPEFTLYMLPVSIDTALSIAQESDYRRWNPALFTHHGQQHDNLIPSSATSA